MSGLFQGVRSDQGVTTAPPDDPTVAPAHAASPAPTGPGAPPVPPRPVASPPPPRASQPPPRRRQASGASAAAPAPDQTAPARRGQKLATAPAAAPPAVLGQRRPPLAPELVERLSGPGRALRRVIYEGTDPAITPPFFVILARVQDGRAYIELRDKASVRMGSPAPTTPPATSPAAAPAAGTSAAAPHAGPSPAAMFGASAPAAAPGATPVPGSPGGAPDAGAQFSPPPPPPRLTIGDPGVLYSPEVRQYLLDPIFSCLHEMYGPEVCVIVNARGKVFAADFATAYHMVIEGRPPIDPSVPQLSVHPSILHVWETAGAFVTNSNSVFGWIGAFAAVLLWGISFVMGWLWLTEIVARLAEAMATFPISSSWSYPLRYAVSLMVSGLEVWGLLFMMSRIPATIGVIIATLDVAFHVSYGIKETLAAASRTGDYALPVFGGILGLLTAIFPEPLLLIMIAAAVRLTPLLPWALIQIRFGMRRMRHVWQRENQRFKDEEARTMRAQGLQPMTVVENGVAMTVWGMPVDRL